MGMAASQARYLGLTARKTNVEYEGQQVNQQRTALANQSANLFNQLLTLQVPTPPSTNDFTKVQYSYEDGTYAETISDMYQNIDADSNEYNYVVKHYHYADVYRGQQQLITNPQVSYVTETSPNGTVIETPTYVGNSELQGYVRGADKDLDTAFDQIYADREDFRSGVDSGQPIYYYTKENKICFGLHNELLASAKSAIDPTKPIENQTIKLPSYFALTQREKVEREEKAKVEIDGSGRVTSVRYKDSSVVYTVNTETITDNAAYEDAMNQYNYDMAKYEKEIADINAQTEIIQEQDRTLELRLRQLDTEQEALQTEMEAVKKVIDKNIESTFKTFE